VTILPPAAGEPRRPDGPRDSGDAWVVAPTGERYWGRYGAAGLLAVDAERGVLLQLRVGWSHFGGTWALPGGARNEGESALDAAVREAQEEAGVPDQAVIPRLMSVFDLGYWSYATVVADVRVPFEAVISDPESVALEWVPLDAVTDRPLHPGFAAAWEGLRALIGLKPALVIDAANVVGSVPNGWWKDRVGAAERLINRVAQVLGSVGFDDEASGAPGLWGTSATPLKWFPETTVVLEGAAREMQNVSLENSAVHVVRAPGSGDDAIVEEVQRLIAAGYATAVVTSDRALRARAESAGARVVSARWLLQQLPDEA